MNNYVKGSAYDTYGSGGGGKVKKNPEKYKGIDGLSTDTQRNLYRYNQDWKENQRLIDYRNNVTRDRQNKPDGYSDSNRTNNLRNTLNKVLAQKPGDFESKYSETMANIVDKMNNGYSINGDNLFKQYSDYYTNQARQGAANAMGNAAALTGGYGSSYGAAAANQAYQQQMSGLYNMMPELQQAWYDQLNNQLNANNQMYANDYNLWNANMANWQNDRDYAQNAYEYNRNFDWNDWNQDVANWRDIRDFDQNRYIDERNFQNQDWQNDRNYWLNLMQLENQDYWKNKEWDKNNSGGGKGGKKNNTPNKNDTQPVRVTPEEKKQIQLQNYNPKRNPRNMTR